MNLKPLLHGTTALYLACGLTAQGGFLYSPSTVATTPSSRNNTIPLGASGSFGSQARYQQVHVGMQGTARVLDQLAFRRPDSKTPYTGTKNSTGTVDVELFMAHADHSKMTTVFGNNYIGGATQVMKRQQVNLPDTQQPPTGSTPWNIQFPFDTLWPYNGKQDLLWELKLYAVVSQNYSIETHDYRQSVSSTSYGTACTPGGQTTSMLQLLTFTLKPWNRSLSVAPRTYYGPANASALIALGAQQTNTALGWCTNLYTNPLLFWFGRTSSSGSFIPPTVDLTWNPAYVNATFYTQGAVNDVSQPGGIALTQGLKTTVPPISTFTEVANRLYTSGGSPASTSGFMTEGYSPTVRFQHK